MIRPLLSLRTDRNLAFITPKAIAHAAHIHRKNLCHIRRDRSAAAVTHLFKHCNMLINCPCRPDTLILQIFCKTQEEFLYSACHPENGLLMNPDSVTTVLGSKQTKSPGRIPKANTSSLLRTILIQKHLHLSIASLNPHYNYHST